MKCKSLHKRFLQYKFLGVLAILLIICLIEDENVSYEMCYLGQEKKQIVNLS